MPISIEEPDDVEAISTIGIDIDESRLRKKGADWALSLYQ